MATDFYQAGLKELIDEGWVAGDWRLLVARDTSSYGYDPDHATIDALTTAGMVEVTATDYVRTALTGKATTVDDTQDGVTLDANPITMTPGPASQTGAFAVVFLHVTDDTDSVPLCVLEDGFPAIFNGEGWVFTFDPTDGVGIILVETPGS